MTRAGQRHDHFHDVLDDDERNAGFVDLAHQRDRRAASVGVRPASASSSSIRRGSSPARARSRAACVRVCRASAPGPGRSSSPVSSRMLARARAHRSAGDGAGTHRPSRCRAPSYLRTSPAPGRCGRCRHGVDLRRGVGQVARRRTQCARWSAHVAGNTIEEGRLACAVRTDQANDLALSTVRSAPATARKLAEALRDVFPPQAA